MTMPLLRIQPLNSPASIAHPPSSFPAMSGLAGCRPSTGLATGRRMLGCVAVALILSINGTGARAEPAGAALDAPFSAGKSIAAFTDEAAQRFGIPAGWIGAVMQAESGGDTRAVSPKGAMGLMQIMPQTWADLCRRYGLGTDPYDAHDNILAGAAYLRELYDRYGEPGFLAAYNAGPARYDNYRATGRPLPPETQAYLAIVAPLLGGATSGDAAVTLVPAQSWTEAPLFVRHARNDAGERGATGAAGLAAQPAALFVSVQAASKRAP